MSLLPYFSPYAGRHPAWLIGFLSHSQYLETQQPPVVRLGFLEEFQKRSLQDMWDVKGDRGAFKTVNFNCGDDLMFSRQKVHGGTC